MKKVLYIIIVVFIIVPFTACNTIKKSTTPESSNNITNSTKSEDNDKTKDIKKEEPHVTLGILSGKDYYSFKENVKLTYEGFGNEYASYTSYVDYIKNNRMQIRINNGGSEAVHVVEYKDGELKLILSRGEIYYREDLTQKTDETYEEILIKEPIKKGTSWTLKDGRNRYISNIDVPITTPSGSYKALEVTTENKNDKTIDYYAPNLGLVKTIFVAKDFEVTSTLSKTETNAKLVQNVKFYYPNINDEKLYYINREMSFSTNDITKMSFQNMFKETYDKNLRNLTGPNVKINSLYLSKDNVVYVDFSKELVTEMNAGAMYESMLLQCIVNTLGEYYGVNKVYLTIAEAPYSSGHIIKEKGEYFIVDIKNSMELKTSAK